MKALYSFVSDFDKKNHAECICYEDRIILKTYNDGGFFRCFDNKEKTIFIRDIASVVVSKGGSYWSLSMYGGGSSYIQFHVKGTSEKSVDEILPHDVSQWKVNELLDNNSILFMFKCREELLEKAIQIKEYIEKQLAIIQNQKEASIKSQATAEDPYQEILKFKGLYDKRIITEDEFFSAIKLILRM